MDEIIEGVNKNARNAEEKRQQMEARKAEKRMEAENKRRTHLILSIVSGTVSAVSFVALVAILWRIRMIPANVAPWIILVPVVTWAFSLGYKLRELGV